MFGWDSSHDDGVQTGADPSPSSGTARVFPGHGLDSETRIASSLGWRPVGQIVPGDKVLTFDHGMQIVTNVRHSTVTFAARNAQDAAMPVTVPVGALGNRLDLTLMPEQGVLVESDAASDAKGDPFAIIPAASLVGFRGIARNCQPREYHIVTLCFATAQLIYGEGGTVVFCPAAIGDLLDMVATEATQYEMLSAQDAAHLVDCMEFEDLSAAFRPAGEAATRAA